MPMLASSAFTEQSVTIRHFQTFVLVVGIVLLIKMNLVNPDERFNS